MNAIDNLEVNMHIIILYVKPALVYLSNPHQFFSLHVDIIFTFAETVPSPLLVACGFPACLLTKMFLVVCWKRFFHLSMCSGFLDAKVSEALMLGCKGALLCWLVFIQMSPQNFIWLFENSTIYAV